MDSNLLELIQKTETLHTSKEKLNKYVEELQALKSKSISPKIQADKFIEIAKQIEKGEEDQVVLNQQIKSNRNEITQELEVAELFINYYQEHLYFIDVSLKAQGEAIPIFEEVIKNGNGSKEHLNLFAKLLEDDTLPTEITEVEVIVLKDKMKEYDDRKKNAEHTLTELLEAKSQLQKIMTLYQKI